MYCRAIACDFDGTGAADGRLLPEVAAALAKARSQGYLTLLVTGRVLEDIQWLCGDHSIFDAIVAENGAVVWLRQTQRMITLGVPPPDYFLGELRRRGVPFHTGAVIVSTWDKHLVDVAELIRRFGIDCQISFNRTSLMLLPSGINKATGVRRALEELGRSERNLLAFGDAENDIPLLSAAEVGVAVRGSVEALAAAADVRLSQSGGAGVAEFIHRVIEQGGFIPTPARRAISVGDTEKGQTVRIPASGINIMVCGDPRSGKSWLAGLLAEQLLEQGYGLCILDPEGDYVALSQRPKTVLLGQDIALPSPGALCRLLRDDALSFILNLSSLSLKDQCAYVGCVLSALDSERAASGMPHWVLIDEAHYFFSGASAALPALDRSGNFIFVTYRPSMITDDICAKVGAYLITGSKIEEERYFLTKLLQARAPADLIPHEALMELEPPRAGLLLDGAAGPQWQVFVPRERITGHVHHARKYADTLLPSDKAFYFLYTNGAGTVVARSVKEFYRAVQTVPQASLRHHLLAGDFSRWFALVLGDEKVASGLRKIEKVTPNMGLPCREHILAYIEGQYRIDPD
ncbi:MAG TPA: HAD-IIB family hydrolase [Candidatus Acidoferrales bacterium]|nr:HAD-IIB family hydrolase [Candidatus Acidoferrales bacterium]